MTNSNQCLTVSEQGSLQTQMTEANFRTFCHHEPQKIMTYSGIVYDLLTHLRQQKNYGY